MTVETAGTELAAQADLHAAAPPEQAPSWMSSASSPIRFHLEHIHNALCAKSSEADYVRSVQPKILEACYDSEDGKNPVASLTAFHAYMASKASHAMQHSMDQDLSAPITDYFISSSHNTYLTGNQLYSNAAAKSYTDVLLSGCRCVEIDVWDGESASEDQSDESSSNSDSEKGDELGSKGHERPKRHGSIKSGIGYHARLNSISTKLEGLLGRGGSTGDSENTTIPELAAPDTTDQVPTSPEPLVLHGHTLTRATTFREVCEAIRDSAFVVSDLPVIVSLEVNASLEQQEAMVDIIQEVWKGLLVEYTSEQEATGTLPALGDLKRKILIKVKWVFHPESGQLTDHPDSSVGDTEPKEQGDEVRPENEHINNNDVSQQSTIPAPPPKKPSKILAALSKLAVYTRAFHFSDFIRPEAKVPGHVFSLSEKAAKNANETHPDLLFEHNRKYFMRVYPSMTRVTSSNLDPSFCWRSGVQMAALNWQNLDEGTMLNHGMFAGGPGWVLKPPGYRSSDSHPDRVIPRKTVDFSIQIFAGHGLSLLPGETDHHESFRPYVKCQLHIEKQGEQQPSGNTGTIASVIAMAKSSKDDGDLDSDKGYCSKRTKTSSGVNADFGGEELQFPRMSGIVDELSFMRIKIKDDKLGRDPLTAWACIRLDRLQEGYRFVQLQDSTGDKPGGVLLAKVVKSVS